ncbi:putative uncharacterized protein DDB_G0289263 [Microplitis mediator]|uniref:putative uncharacterized protein DDB_G0289263 n=1 Tax=Microplitis mediator TaxID=375433 RepID=UPI002553DDE1|nr:putative uncharacterized protein DDB_G0289263 [Microplitis mediator]
MRTFLRKAESVNQVIEKLRQNFGRMETFHAVIHRLTGMIQENNESVTKFGARLEGIKAEAENKINRSGLTAEQKDYRTKDLEATVLETFINGLYEKLSFAVSNKEPRTLADAIKIAMEAEIQYERTKAAERAREGKLRFKEREHARIRQLTLEEEVKEESKQEGTEYVHKPKPSAEFTYTITNEKIADNGDKRSCFTCGQVGHLARNCPVPIQSKRNSWAPMNQQEFRGRVPQQQERYYVQNDRYRGNGRYNYGRSGNNWQNNGNYVYGQNGNNYNGYRNGNNYGNQWGNYGNNGYYGRGRGQEFQGNLNRRYNNYGNSGAMVTNAFETQRLMNSLPGNYDNRWDGSRGVNQQNRGNQMSNRGPNTRPLN